MFKRDVKSLGDVLQHYLRKEGLETPLLQMRVVDAWPKIVGESVNGYTAERFIKNQVLFVKVTNPALRQNLSMMHTQLTKRLNEMVGTSVITDVRVY
ncbi:DciA family protein [Hallella colorans]|jgi:hypothetical protein|uniref:Uncharacterized protein DUF721 n=1 Tax=Hallella colorans TaxID=1703337 RepID=A0A2U0U1L5_9BACT|nr:DUF721 domain-containing protein [Hallella colorans]PVX50166.1 uncharacterized protein DUF721 [Hallella colorans]